MKTAVVTVVCSLILALFTLESVCAQTCTPPTTRAKILASDTGTGRDTLWFGHDATATKGLDPSLCEVEFPPFPPAGIFEARFVNPPGYDGIEPPAGMGQGFKQDYRPRVAFADTFRLKFQPNEPPGYPVTFNWTPSEITAVYDSAWLMDEFFGLILKARMHVASSLVVPSSAFQTILMVTFHPLVGVEQESNALPAGFRLEQNYPNPFNPSTTIRFAVQRLAQTEITVYDVLGRRVKTLASQMMSPGFYRTTWNGTDDAGRLVSSGIYFVRMSANAGEGPGWSAMQKVMLLK